jgi:hypothetical protein
MDLQLILDALQMLARGLFELRAGSFLKSFFPAQAFSHRHAISDFLTTRFNSPLGDGSAVREIKRWLTAAASEGLR